MAKLKYYSQAWCILFDMVHHKMEYTPFIAFRLYGCCSLQQRIWELQQHGLVIDNLRKGNGHAIYALRRMKRNLEKARRMLARC